jgi:hypothetical protein
MNLGGQKIDIPIYREVEYQFPVCITKVYKISQAYVKLYSRFTSKFYSICSQPKFAGNFTC